MSTAAMSTAATFGGFVSLIVMLGAVGQRAADP
jgi:hypothetical protein